MKKMVVFLMAITISHANYSQDIYTIKGDSIKLTNESGNTELIIENSTRHIPGYLYNTGNGKTEFKTITTTSPLTFNSGLTNTNNIVTNNLITGISGGQVIVGGTGSGNDLTLSSTINSTKGKILFGTSAYDEVNNHLGLGYSTPTNTLHVGGTGLRVDGWFLESTEIKGVYLGINPEDNSPRILFANGHAGQNWQIDNCYGNFRWYLPGVDHMVLRLDSLSLIDKIISVTGTGNNYFAGKVGMGSRTPTALIHLKSGTASSGTSPLKFTTGVNLSIPEDGAIEYDGTHFYGTIGTVRHQLDQQGTSLPIAITSSTNSSYTLNISDAGKLITQNNGSPNIITVPANSLVAFLIGTKIIINQYGTGQTTISKDTGVVINSLGGALLLQGKDATATLTKVSTDTWILNGDITNNIN